MNSKVRRQLTGIAIVLTATLAAGCSGDSGADMTAPTPTLSGSATGSPPASGTPSATASQSPSATGSSRPSPSSSATSTGKPKPSPSGSLAEDGLPIVVIEQPEAGASVNIPVQISGTVVAFEAVLRYEILDSKGRLFTNGPAYADAGAPDRGSWQVEVELPIGSYTVVAFVLSPKDGKRIASDRVKFRAG
ncbi:MAG TPA: Gmad2 immunoglobulin-like domain-containing protein [Candidatus Limnocylindria bacterium]|nr:Gmad2 immunoglobulin-like domain-containing protein [Candidatus Limnocylindria bacterium]